ncbi:MAG: ankyrin repeat domain-containing protein [Candidatus Korobacteraceae bacterium]
MDDIFAAITANDKDRVAQLIAADLGVAHTRNSAGISALMQARYENRMEIVDLLRPAAGDLDIFESSAFGDAAQLNKLLASDADLVKARGADGFTPLHLACFFGQLKAAEILVRHGADTNAVSPSRIAIIHSAAASRNADLLKLVLEAGANPNSQQQRGYTALHEAAMHNSVERAQALLKAGADPAIQSDEGQTAADMAAQNGNKGVLEVLQSFRRGVASA